MKKQTNFIMTGIIYILLSFMAFLEFAIDLKKLTDKLQIREDNGLEDKLVDKLFYFNSCEINECIIMANAIFKIDIISFYTGVYFILFRIIETFIGYLLYDLELYYITCILYLKLIVIIYFYFSIKKYRKWETYKMVGASLNLQKCYDLRRKLNIARRLSFSFHIIPLMIGYKYKPKFFSYYSTIIFSLCHILEKRENNEDKISKMACISLWLVDLCIHIYKMREGYYEYKG
ncbi:hypothetical protein TCON_2409 [Astathelohania contejeani]|uniref:Uncharacterized protein n=1 Tax=Astathelohania contejeani TaxID=164912 RepID=A0ABQ7HW40_9MICR|nr:hypothetical protein TCON_2409 [Thelohania contejeani]